MRDVWLVVVRGLNRAPALRCGRYTCRLRPVDLRFGLERAKGIEPS
jgi:hypothetical protein